VNRTFTSNEVVALTGITPRQLQWWDEGGIVVPAREGHRRLYSFDDVAEIAVICELRQRAFSLQRVRKVIRFLQRELGKRLVETVSEGSEFHLLTDGQNIFLEDSAQGVVNVLKNSRQPMLAICLSDTVTRIKADVSGVPVAPIESETLPPRAMAASAAAGSRVAAFRNAKGSNGSIARGRKRKRAS
jgi:DNA-binding transcriptional MerR regulator